MADGEGRPVLTGLVALVAVAVVVGLVLGGGALAATQVLGLGGDEATSESTVADSMYLPTPSETPESNDPLYTLAPGEESSVPSESPSESETPADGITLAAGQSEVGPMERIDLTGVYPGGEGAILQVERFVDGGWGEFEVTVPVSNETFSTYVQTGQTGVNKFRLRDSDKDLVSNVVSITVR